MKLLNILNKFIPGDKKAVVGTLWNICSMAVVGFAGILMNFVIAKQGSSDILGIYNKLMAIYIILGQVASGGSQHAIIYYWNNTEQDDERGKICISLLVGTIINSVLSIVIMLIFRQFLALINRAEDDMLYGMVCMIPALFLFGINKYLLGFLNANRAMEKYAALQMLRYIGLILYVIVVLSISPSMLYYSFFFAEGLVLLGAIVSVKKYWRISKDNIKNMADKWRFGYKAMLGGIVGETNTKVDVLVLGLFVSSSNVGVYSFASLIAEGFYSLILVFRNNLNPVFAKQIAYKDKGELKKLQKEVTKKIPFLCLAGTVVLLLGFGLGCYILGMKEYYASLIPMAILLIAQCIASTEIVKGNVLTVSGRPEKDSSITILTLGCNICMNFILVPLGGLIGAAIATAISYVMYKMLIIFYHKKYCFDLGE